MPEKTTKEKKAAAQSQPSIEPPKIEFPKFVNVNERRQYGPWEVSWQPIISLLDSDGSPTLAILPRNYTHTKEALRLLQSLDEAGITEEQKTKMLEAWKQLIASGVCEAIT